MESFWRSVGQSTSLQKNRSNRRMENEKKKIFFHFDFECDGVSESDAGFGSGKQADDSEVCCE